MVTFLFKMYKIEIMSEYILNQSSKMCFYLIPNCYSMSIICVYILTILDRVGCQPLQSSPVHRHILYIERSSSGYNVQSYIGPVNTWSLHAFSLIGYVSDLLKRFHLHLAT